MRPFFSVTLIVLASVACLSAAGLDKPVLKGFQLGMDLPAALANAKQLAATTGLNINSIQLAPIQGGPMQEVAVGNLPQAHTFAFKASSASQTPIGVVYYGQSGFVFESNANGKIIMVAILPSATAQLFQTSQLSADDLLNIVRVGCKIPQFTFVKSRPPFAHWLYTDTEGGWAISVYLDKHIEMVDTSAQPAKTDTTK